MSRQLVLSGDDFGMSEAFNIGAMRAAREGVVSVLALMVNLPASEHAVRLHARFAPEVPLALHFNVVLGRPLSDPRSIPSLVDERGCFYRSSQWRSDDPADTKCAGAVYPNAADVRYEALAQLERFHELTGSYPSHIDCHSVMVRPVAEGLHAIAGELGIHCEGALRVHPGWGKTCGECMPVGGNAERVRITSRGSSVADWERDAFGVLACPYDIAVVHAHPGYIDQVVLDSTSLTLPRCRDFATLTDKRTRTAIERQGIELVSYEAVYPDGFKEPDRAMVDALTCRCKGSVR